MPRLLRLARGELSKYETIVALASRYDRSPAQIVLRWHVQQGIVPLPKSSTVERIRSNIDLSDFDLSDADMSRISALDKHYRTGPNPDEVG